MSAEIADAEVVEEPGTDLVPHQASGTLFRSDDPAEVIERASSVAKVLKKVLTDQRLTKNIGGREHVLVEGWTTCGAMLGVVPVVEWTRQTENGWEARVEARTLDGRTIGAAESSCTRDEKTWKSRDDYALRSMAQTRATSKALRGPLGFIVTLAGFDATPSDEMPSEPAAAAPEKPLGIPFDREKLMKTLGPACTKIAGGEGAQGMALFKWVEEKCGGYMPAAAAMALILAARALDGNLVPDVRPDPEGDLG